RDYVDAGGQLLIAAGGAFDPAAWMRSAWNDGNGILPAPLEVHLVGRLPNEAIGELSPFFLAPGTIDENLLELDDVAQNELDELFQTPVFFRAVATHVPTA